MKNLRIKQNFLISKSSFRYSYFSNVQTCSQILVLCNVIGGPGGPGKPGRPGGGSTPWHILVNAINVGAALGRQVSRMQSTRFGSYGTQIAATAADAQVRRNLRDGFIGYLGVVASVNLRDFQAIQAITTRAQNINSEMIDLSQSIVNLTPATANAGQLSLINHRMANVLHERDIIQGHSHLFHNPTPFDVFLHTLAFVQFRRSLQGTILPLVPNIDPGVLNHLQTLNPVTQKAVVAQVLSRPPFQTIPYPMNPITFIVIIGLIIGAFMGGNPNIPNGSFSAFPFMMQTGINLEYVVQWAPIVMQVFLYALSQYLLTSFILKRLAAVLPKGFVERVDQLSDQLVKWGILLVGNVFGIFIVYPVLYIYHMGIWFPVQFFRIIVLNHKLPNLPETENGEESKTVGEGC